MSLPVSAYTTAPIADLHHLCSRLSAHSLPDGWIIHVDDTHNDLILSSLTIDASTLLPTTTFIIKVDHNLKWSLCCNGILVKNEQTLGDLNDSQQITSLNDLLTILSSVQVSCICCGNSVEEFKNLIKDRGDFKDLEGYWIAYS